MGTRTIKAQKALEWYQSIIASKPDRDRLRGMAHNAHHAIRANAHAMLASYTDERDATALEEKIGIALEEKDQRV